MRTWTVVILLMVTACDPIDFRLKLDNPTSDTLFYIVSQTKELHDKDLYYVDPSGDTILGSQNGTLDPRSVTEVPSIFGIGTNTWGQGINEHCEDSTLTIFIYKKELRSDNRNLKQIDWRKPKQTIRTRTDQLEARDWLIKLE